MHFFLVFFLHDYIQTINLWLYSFFVALFFKTKSKRRKSIMLQKTIGIVLHSIKCNDTSNIVDIYNELSGRASFLVKLPRSKKSAVKSVLFQPLSIIELEAEFRPTSNLHRVKEAKSYYPFSSLPYNPYKSAIALFIAEFLYRAVREEATNPPLFAYLVYSIQWLDEQERGYVNFHLVFLMRLSRFLGLYPNLEDYHNGDYFDLLNACFIAKKPFHNSFIKPEEASRLVQIMRMNYDTMHLFAMSRVERSRCLAIIIEYYRLHLPEFPTLKSIDILKELFD